MTSRQVWEGLLTELSKLNAPSMLLKDFNYFINKSIHLYVNKRYNLYDVNQLTTDDIRVLKSTAILNPEHTGLSTLPGLNEYSAGQAKMFDATYEVTLPDDYLHLLNCICIYQLKEDDVCYDKGNYVHFPATRLTADNWSKISVDYYTRPLPLRPYYYIHNVNTIEDNLTPNNPILLEDDGSLKSGTDLSYSPDLTEWKNFINTEEFRNKILVNGSAPITDFSITSIQDGNQYKIYISREFGFGNDISISYLTNGNYNISEIQKMTLNVKSKSLIDGDVFSNIQPCFVIETPSTSSFPRILKVNSIKNISTVDKTAGQRYGNTSKVRMEIRYGHDKSVYELVKVLVDYIKVPLYIRLTQELVNLTKDTSLVMEFPDTVCNEIINELVNLVMEHNADPRLLTHPRITESIASPAQQLAQPATKKA